MQPISIGPIKWNAAGLSPQAPTAAGTAAARRLQEESQQADREERKVLLDALAKADQKAIHKIMAQLVALATSPLVTRRVAAALLARPELGALLDLKANWSSEASGWCSTACRRASRSVHQQPRPHPEVPGLCHKQCCFHPDACARSFPWFGLAE